MFISPAESGRGFPALVLCKIGAVSRQLREAPIEKRSCYVWTMSTAATAPQRTKGVDGILYVYAHSIEDGTLMIQEDCFRLPRQCAGSAETLHRCLSEVDFPARATSPTRCRHGSRSKQRSLHGSEFALKLVCRQCREPRFKR